MDNNKKTIKESRLQSVKKQLKAKVNLNLIKTDIDMLDRRSFFTLLPPLAIAGIGGVCLTTRSSLLGKTNQACTWYIPVVEECSNYPCQLSCTVCQDVCPTEAIVFDSCNLPDVTDECICCGECVTECPAQAIFIIS